MLLLQNSPFGIILVLFSDDVLYDNAVSTYIANIKNDVDILATNVIFNNKIKYKKKGPLWLVGPQNKIVAHSIGCLIKKQLHFEFGYYVLDLKIAADTLFLLKVLKSNSKIHFCDKIVGEYGKHGISNINYSRMAYEHMLAHYRAGSNLLLQAFIMIAKQAYFIFKFFFRLK